MGKNIEDQVKKAVGNEPVPESLHPEQIEKMLEGRKPKRFSSRRLGAAAAAVAVIALAGGVGFHAWHGDKQEGRVDEQSAMASGDWENEEAYVKDAEIPEGVAVAKSYEQVFEILESSNAIHSVYMDESYVYAESSMKSSMEGAASDKGSYGQESAAAAEDSDSISSIVVYNDADNIAFDTTDESGDEADFSQVNAQVEGVAEADIMVTDGAYLYMCYENRDRICIVTPDKQTGKLVLSSEIDLGKDIRVEEMYIQKGQLIVLADEYERTQTAEELCQTPSFLDGLLYGASDCIYPYMTKMHTLAITYDVSDREHPKEKGRVKVDGAFQSSRLADGYLYMFSQYNDFYMVKENMVDDAESYIPCVQDTCIAKERIFIPDTEQAQGYLVGVSVDINEPDKVTDEFAVMMYGTEFYVSQSNIYIAQDFNDVQIVCFSYQHGEIHAQASGKVRGWINDNFSMDEYNGYLRLVTTSWKGDIAVTEGMERTEVDTDEAKAEDIEADSSGDMALKLALPVDEGVTETVNNLYILDYNLDIAGKIEDLAPGERIYSARFMGDVGYFVTYREVDPLFSVDLSSPYSPKVLGELKVSGFSEYLHPYGEGRLLGIGWETISNGYGGVMQDGLKLSMFDNSNPSDVSELARMIQKNVISSDVGSNYHAVMISAAKNLFGFCVQTSEETRYCTYRYTEGVGFEVVTDTKLDNEWNYWGTRGVYIEDIIYICDGTHVYSVSLADGTLLDELYLNSADDE